LVSDVFEEVEEGLRRDKYAEFFQKNAVALGAGVVLILVAVGGYQAWRAWDMNHAGSYAMRMEDATALLQAHNFPEAEKQLSEIASGAPAGYKTSALLALGGARSERGDAKGALEAYDRAAAASPTKEYRDVARLRAAYVAADLEPASLETRLKPLIDEGGPFAFQARELRAMQAYGAGDLAKAREEFDFLSIAVDVPRSIQGRARSALAVIGPVPQGAAPADAPPPSSKPGEQK
jgi:hypothetical protein